jgi:glycosyltransferase involved in cell wall biosynthesis
LVFQISAPLKDINPVEVLFMKQCLRIGIAARGLNSYFSGPREYIEGFVGAFVRQAAPCQVYLYYNTDEFVGRYPQAVERVVPRVSDLFWDHLLLPHALRRDNIDLAIFPKGTIPLVQPCRSIPIALDMGYFYPELNAYKVLNTIYMRSALRYSAKQAWGVFTISQTTANDVIRLFGVAPERVQNIYGGVYAHYQPVVDVDILESVRKRYGLETPFMFYPTSISPRKNIDRALDAFEQIQDQVPHHLYFTGKVAWKSSTTEERLRGPISARVHRLGSVRYEDMPALYSLADFTIYPSLFEGLGLPVLEAFKCGSPVMTSDQSCLPEVAGDSALIVEGYNTQSIAQGMLRLAEDKELRQLLRQRGFQRVKMFTWENTVRAALGWIDSHWD